MSWKIIILLIVPNLLYSREVCISDDSLEVCESPKKYINKDILVFVTPWNDQGYKNVIQYAQKLDYVSPVWFRLEKDEKTYEVSFQGEQDIKEDWLEELRNANPNLKIVPRFHLPAIQGYYNYLLGNELNLDRILHHLKKLAKKYKFDGYVYDFPLLNTLSQIQGIENFFFEVKSVLEENLLRIGTFLGNKMHMRHKSEDMARYRIFFGDKNLHKVLIGTYDYQNKEEHQIYNSPTYWIKSNISFYKELFNDDLKSMQINFEEKVMFGIPFYGHYLEMNSGDYNQIGYDSFKKYMNTKEFSYIWNDEHSEC